MKQQTPTVLATHADPRLLNLKAGYFEPEETYSAERLLFLSENCRKLADFLCTVPDSDHNQHSWVYESEHSTCGTVGCAMGWAALSHVIPGLQYLKQGGAYRPAINGKASDWVRAPISFFGTRAMEKIFQDIFAGRIKTINRLYRESERLCELHKKKKAKACSGSAAV